MNIKEKLLLVLCVGVIAHRIVCYTPSSEVEEPSYNGNNASEDVIANPEPILIEKSLLSDTPVSQAVVAPQIKDIRKNLFTSDIDELLNVTSVDLAAQEEKTLEMWYMRVTKLIETAMRQDIQLGRLYEDLRDGLMSDARIQRGQGAKEAEINKDITGLPHLALNSWYVTTSKNATVDQKIRVANKFNKEKQRRASI